MIHFINGKAFTRFRKAACYFTVNCKLNLVTHSPYNANSELKKPKNGRGASSIFFDFSNAMLTEGFVKQ